jgi:hypothetical protein
MFIGHTGGCIDYFTMTYGAARTGSRPRRPRRGAASVRSCAPLRAVRAHGERERPGTERLREMSEILGAASLPFARSSVRLCALCASVVGFRFGPQRRSAGGTSEDHRGAEGTEEHRGQSEGARPVTSRRPSASGPSASAPSP